VLIQIINNKKKMEELDQLEMFIIKFQDYFQLQMDLEIVELKWEMIQILKEELIEEL
jgi:hypothetical protein